MFGKDGPRLPRVGHSRYRARGPAMTTDSRPGTRVPKMRAVRLIPYFRRSEKYLQNAVDSGPHFTVRYIIPIHSTRGALMRRLEGGERERHLRAKDLRNLCPRAVLGQPRRPLGAGPVRPRSNAERQRCRVGAPQGAGRDASRPGPGAPGPPWSHALQGRSGEIQAMRLVGAPTPSPEGEAKRQECGRPSGPKQQTGGGFLLTQGNSL